LFAAKYRQEYRELIDMAEPFDLENQPPDPSQRPKTPLPPGPGMNSPQRGQLPTTRASDILKSGRSGKTINGLVQGDPNKPTGPDIDRRATVFDDAASGILAITGLLFLVGVGYLLWGMWSGAFADPNWTTTYDHGDRLRALQNISLCGTVMWWAISISIVLFLFLFYHEDYSGYALLAGALIMQLGIPYATKLIYGSDQQHPTMATDLIFQLLSSQSWVIGIPGGALTLFSMFKATVSGLEEAKVKRSTMQFGQKAIRDNKPRNMFLGPCWNLPFCKDSIRGKCPIYIKKSGPCWRNKRGCMCDQTILLIAQAPNWKQNVNATVGKLEGKFGGSSMPELPPQPQLSRQAKIERCRQCVIFNYHQEQKYKLAVGIVLTATLGTVVLLNSQLLNGIGALFMGANALIGRFSTGTHAAPLYPNGAPASVEWLILISVLLVVVAKVLQTAEYVCFKLKI
jgi:hypothetical protein